MNRITPLWAVFLVLAAPFAGAQQGMDDVTISAEPAGKGLYMLTGRGGNIGVSAGPEGVFLIDDQYAPLTPKILAAVAEITDAPVRFVLNTHWHGDHTGGNENLGNAGVLIVAHDNVRERLAADQSIELFQRKFPAAPDAALPVVTFEDSVTFHLNGEHIHAFHVSRAHTDGDAIVHFRKADVVHMGDTFFNSSYPFIDVQNGGSIDGMIAAVDRVLEMIDADTVVMPGHGPLSSGAELQAYRDMLSAVRNEVVRLIGAGKSLQEVVEAVPTAAFDARWGGSTFMPPDRWLGILYNDLSR